MQKKGCESGCEFCKDYEFREMDFRRSKKSCGCLSFFKSNDDSSYDSDTSSGCRTSDVGMEIQTRCTHKTKLKSMKGLLHIPFPHKILNFLKREETASMTKVERTIKAALLIQKWYRRYLARMEIRRRSTWTIFQSIEYAGEQDQLKLYNFFNALLNHIYDAAAKKGKLSSDSRTSSPESLPVEFLDEPENEGDDLKQGDREYKGIHINIPPTKENLYDLIDTYRRSRYHRLHPRYVVGILKEGIKNLKKQPNLNQASTAISKQVTICGDLHGNLDDLLVVFHKNGLPSPENPYVFNGDFVDRGKKSLEVLLVLLACLEVFPGGVFLNRGNHEDLIMNARYGFLKELQRKYPNNYERLIKLIESVYRWLPLGSIVNNKVLVVHGGISDTTDLDMIRSLDRGKYLSLLRPPIAMDGGGTAGLEYIDKVEWKQVFDILWSDPQTNTGCIANKLRGAGTYFGPDVTESFLERNRMIYIVRSHECKPDGYEIIHNGKVITVFSASNYYEVGSNRGAYVKLVGSRLDPHFVQFTTEKSTKFTFRERVGLVESSAIRELWRQILKHKESLSKEFRKADQDSVGSISIRDWCNIMEKVINLGLPWRMLREKLVTLDTETQRVWYESTFDRINKDAIMKEDNAASVVETLYRNRSNLETIFRIIDKDNSGYISLEEFSDACNLINEHMPNPITRDQIEDICNLMDINKDGVVDLNEFLETFRMVDPVQKDKSFDDQQNGIPPQSSTQQPSTPKLREIAKSNEESTSKYSSSVFGSPVHNLLTDQAESSPKLNRITDSPDITKAKIENRNITVTINRTSPISRQVTESPVLSDRSMKNLGTQKGLNLQKTESSGNIEQPNLQSSIY